MAFVVGDTWIFEETDEIGITCEAGFTSEVDLIFEVGSVCKVELDWDVEWICEVDVDECCVATRTRVCTLALKSLLSSPTTFPDG